VRCKGKVEKVEERDGWAGFVDERLMGEVSARNVEMDTEKRKQAWVSTRPSEGFAI
jgi:hypothetical protein